MLYNLGSITLNIHLFWRQYFIWQLREILEAEGMCRQMFAEKGLEEVKQRMADALQNYQTNGSVSTLAPHKGCFSDTSNLILNLT